MKQFFQKPLNFTLLVLSVVLLSWSNLKAQSLPCNVGISYTLGANGTVTFAATNAGTVNTNYFMWWYGNGNSSGSTTLSTVVNTYTANGIYTVNMFSYNVPTTYSCGSTQTINITTAPTPTCGLNASFTYTVGANGNVNFTSTSSNTTAGSTYFWSFGNGGSSNAMNPSTTYTANGSYFVYFGVSNSANCQDSTGQMITVSNVVGTPTCGASFTYTNGTGGTVNFTGANSGASGTNYYQWSWGDGTSNASSTNNNATHVYANNGVYTVYLFSYNMPFTYSCSAVQTITVTNAAPCTINASFTYTLGANGNVMFTNTSTGTNAGTQYQWYFGNGNSSTLANPSTNYSANGNYFVYFSASNGTCQDSTGQMITISNASPGGCATNMTYTMGPNGNVGFTATNSGTTSTNYYQWNFGNGTSSSSSTLNTANATYTANGTYTVWLFSYNVPTTYSCSAMQVVTVTTAGCNVNSNFFLVKDSTQNFTWDAYPTFPSNIVSATWYWGDGSSTTGLYPTHTYSAAGAYNICLSVSVACGATQTTCVTSNIYKSMSNANSQLIFVNVKASAPTGISSQSETSQLKLFPNPNSGSFVILSPVESDIEILDAVGRMVHKQKLAEGKNQLSLEHLSKGLYFVKDVNSKTPVKMVIQ